MCLRCTAVDKRLFFESRVYEDSIEIRAQGKPLVFSNEDNVVTMKRHFASLLGCIKYGDLK